MTEKENALEVEVKFKLPKSAVDFIDFLCGLNGFNRGGWLRAVIRGDLESFLNDPTSEWDEDWMKTRFGLAPFLSEEGCDEEG